MHRSRLPKSIVRAALLCLLLTALCSCRVDLPFRLQLPSDLGGEAARMKRGGRGPIALRWEPPDFPQRIDLQGASSYVGSASKTVIPTGPAIAGRVRDFADAALGVDGKASVVVTIRIVEAKTSFEYSAFSSRPTIDKARCSLKVDIDEGGSRWSETYFSSNEPGPTPKSQTELLDRVWDEVSAALGRDIVRHLAEPPRLRHGFRSYAWGEPPPKGSELLNAPKPGFERRRVPSEPLSIGGVALTSLSFNYWKGRLWAVIATTNDPDALEAVLVRSWGPGQPTAPGRRELSWSSREGGKATAASLEWKKVGDLAVLTVASVDLFQEQQREEKAGGLGTRGGD